MADELIKKAALDAVTEKTEDGKVVLKDDAISSPNGSVEELDYSEPTSSLKENTTETAKAEPAKEEKTEPVKTEPVAEVAKPEKSFDEIISEKSNGKYKSLEELEKVFSEEPKEHQYANDFIKRMDELAKSGVDVNLNFISAQLVDYNKYDTSNVDHAKELVRMELKLNDPEMSDKEIDYELQDRYKLDENEYTDAEVERSKLKLQREAKKAQQKLVDNQRNLALPKTEPKAATPQVDEKQKRALEEITKEIKKSVTTYEKESFKVGDENFDFAITDDARKGLEKVMTNTDKFFLRYSNKDGSINFDKFRKEMFLIENFESVLTTAVNQAVSKGKKDVVKDLKNTSFDPASPTGVAEPKGISDHIAAHFASKK